MEPENVTAQRGAAQAAKGVAWDDVTAQRSASHRAHAHKETRMRGSKFLGQGDYD